MNEESTLRMERFSIFLSEIHYGFKRRLMLSSHGNLKNIDYFDLESQKFGPKSRSLFGERAAFGQSNPFRHKNV